MAKPRYVENDLNQITGTAVEPATSHNDRFFFANTPRIAAQPGPGWEDLSPSLSRLILAYKQAESDIVTPADTAKAVAASGSRMQTLLKEGKSIDQALAAMSAKGEVDEANSPAYIRQWHKTLGSLYAQRDGNALMNDMQERLSAAMEGGTTGAVTAPVAAPESLIPVRQQSTFDEINAINPDMANSRWFREGYGTESSRLMPRFLQQSQETHNAAVKLASRSTFGIALDRQMDFLVTETDEAKVTEGLAELGKWTDEVLRRPGLAGSRKFVVDTVIAKGERIYADNVANGGGEDKAYEFLSRARRLNLGGSTLDRGVEGAALSRAVAEAWNKSSSNTGTSNSRRTAAAENLYHTLITTPGSKFAELKDAVTKARSEGEVATGMDALTAYLETEEGTKEVPLGLRESVMENVAARTSRWARVSQARAKQTVDDFTKLLRNPSWTDAQAEEFISAAPDSVVGDMAKALGDARKSRAVYQNYPEVKSAYDWLLNRSEAMDKITIPSDRADEQAAIDAAYVSLNTMVSSVPKGADGVPTADGIAVLLTSGKLGKLRSDALLPSIARNERNASGRNTLNDAVRDRLSPRAAREALLKAVPGLGDDAADSLVANVYGKSQLGQALEELDNPNRSGGMVARVKAELEIRLLANGPSTLVEKASSGGMPTGAPKLRLSPAGELVVFEMMRTYRSDMRDWLLGGDPVEGGATSKAAGLELVQGIEAQNSLLVAQMLEAATAADLKTRARSLVAPERGR